MEKTPRVYLIGETVINHPVLSRYFTDTIGHGWGTDSHSDSEMLAEVMGRICYKSFEAGLNPNVSRVREGNKNYLKNIVESRHGSVLEHATLNFIFAGVSRVFTHELVRHRVGVGVSQESMRYVRLDSLEYTALNDPEIDPEIDNDINWAIDRVFQAAAKEYSALVEKVGFDRLTMDMKKKITSKLRRMIPMGVSTTIGWSCNLRTLRTVLEQRTSKSAEIEMRKVFGEVADIVTKKFPGFFQDYVRTEDPPGSGLYVWAPATDKTVKI